MNSHEQRIAEWLRETAEANDVSFEAWAIRAGTSGTNITRFLKHGRPVPKLATLLLLAEAIGTLPPTLTKSVTVGVDFVPLVKPSWILLGGWERARQQATEHIAVGPAVTGAVAFRVTNDRAAPWHILAGDTVIVRPDEIAPEGALVAVAGEGDDIDIMRHAPPLLIPAGIDAAPQRIEERMILGTVLQAIRSFSA